MKCAFCRRAGTGTNLKKLSSGAWRCKDASKCLAARLHEWKTPNKRAQWKKRSNPK